MALRRILASPEFVFRVEREPANVKIGASYRISDLELASRLSFFLWSSIPDDELIKLASQGKLKDPAVLAAQVRRMLLDSRSSQLVNNFAGQWLYLRNLQSITPAIEDFPGSTTICGKLSAAKRNSSLKASFAKITAWSIC